MESTLHPASAEIKLGGWYLAGRFSNNIELFLGGFNFTAPSYLYVASK